MSLWPKHRQQSLPIASVVGARSTCAAPDHNQGLSSRHIGDVAISLVIASSRTRD